MSEQLTIKDLLEILEGIAPAGLAEQWDNVGLMVGNPTQQINGLLLALDPTEEILAEARELGVNTIITHHPLIFHPLKAISTDQPLGRFLQKALANDISVIGCHTNLDQVVNGVSDVLALSLGMKDSRPLIPATEAGASGVEGGGQVSGFGRLGRLAEPLSREAFITKLGQALALPVVRVAGQVPEEISVLAVCGGSGSDLAEIALSLGAQVYVTGEVKHSTARWAEAAGFCIVDAGHFATENPVVESLAENLRGIFTEKGHNVAVQTTANQKNPFVYYDPQGS
jgi:dinuclear metal center YbgI/SA1388 family protein